MSWVMNRIDDRTSARLKNLNLGCTILIVMMHLVYAGVDSAFDNPFCHFLESQAVPLFFAMSGFLLAHGLERKGFGKLFASRFRTLVVPYFLLNTLFIPVLYVYHNVLGRGNWDVGSRMALNWYTVSRIYGLDPDINPACGTLWFVRCLVFFVLLSPILAAVVRRGKVHALILVLALFGLERGLTALQLPSPWGFRFYYTFNLFGFAMFGLGLALAHYGKDIAGWVGRIPRGKAVLTVGCLMLASVRFAMPEGDFNSPCLALIALMGLWAPSARLPAWATSHCFAVYAFHCVVFQAWPVVLQHAHLPSLATSQALSLVPFALALAICGLVSHVLKKSAPAVAGLLFGGR